MQVIAASEYLKMRNKRLRISCYIPRYSLSSSLNCIQLSRNNNLLEARSLNSDFWRLNHTIKSLYTLQFGLLYDIILV